jgi:hypothetical protein
MKIFHALLAISATKANVEWPTVGWRGWWSCHTGGTWGMCAPGEVLVGTCSGKGEQSCLDKCAAPDMTASAFAYICDDINNEAQPFINTTNTTKNAAAGATAAPAAAAPPPPGGMARADSRGSGPTSRKRPSAAAPPPSTVSWICGKAGEAVTCPLNTTTRETGVVVGLCGSGAQASCKIDSTTGHKGCDHKKGHDKANHAIACDMGYRVTVAEEDCYHECSDSQEWKSCAAGYTAVGHCADGAKAKCGRSVPDCAQYPRTFSALKCCKVHKPDWSAPEGRWNLAVSGAGGANVSETLVKGILTTDTRTITKSWSKSVQTSISMGFSFAGFSFSASVSTDVCNTVSNSVSQSTTHMLENTCEAKCPAHPDGLPVYLYQWHMDFKRGYGTAYMDPATTLDTCDYYCIYAQNPKPPACPLGACADDQCTVCTPGWNVTNTSSNV